MTRSALPTSGFGFSWVLPFGKDLLTKSVAPSFLFVDNATFSNTNIRHRLAKRMIDAYVSINAPFWLLASVYGWDEAASELSSDDDTDVVEHACNYVVQAMESACDNGADAIVLCDDLCGSKGPLLDPLFVVEHLLPLYTRFGDKAEELGVPLIFHSDGDIREYYPHLANDGFAGIHVAHPNFEQTTELFDSVREQGMVPLGGLVSSHATEGSDKLGSFASGLLASGPALICDDGAVNTREQFEPIVEAMRICRAANGGS